MRYQNVNNGVIISVQSKIGGKDWIPVEEGQAKKVPAKSVAQIVPKTEPAEPVSSAHANGDDFDAITVKQIKQELDANGIAYSKTAKKQELYDLMMGM